MKRDIHPQTWVVLILLLYYLDGHSKPNIAINETRVWIRIVSTVWASQVPMQCLTPPIATAIYYQCFGLSYDRNCISIIERARSAEQPRYVPKNIGKSSKSLLALWGLGATTRGVSAGAAVGLDVCAGSLVL